MQLSRFEVLQEERSLESAVSAYIGRMTVLWLGINDAPGPDSKRGVIERNTIALLSNFKRPDKLDPPSPGWLGSHSDRERVRLSGLWNNNHVDEAYDPRFFAVFEGLLTGQSGKRALLLGRGLSTR
jgi:hypothetical protein